MNRRVTRSSIQQNRVDSSSSDDDSLELQTASDVINSFLNPSTKTTQSINSTRKAQNSRKATDVINSFLQKKKIVNQANSSQFRSALDVINSYLQNDRNERNKTFTGMVAIPRKLIENTDDSTSSSESESGLVSSQKRRRQITESSSSSDSDSDDSPVVRNTNKKRRIEDDCSTATTKTSEQNDEIKNEPTGQPDFIPEETPNNSDNPSSTDHLSTNAVPSHHQVPNEVQSDNQVTSEVQAHKDVSSNGSVPIEESRQSASSPTTQRTLRSSKTNGNSWGANRTKSNVRAKKKPSEAIKLSFTREVFSRKLGTRKVVEQQTTVRDSRIPKDKYDRALDILNATECRYDETPIDHNALKSGYNVRRTCINRRHAEATHDTLKLGTSEQISLTRIVMELDNCLKRENWRQMAELIYFGCGLMKTDQSRRAIGTTFFTYALLLLLLDSTPGCISTMDGKRNEIRKFLIALGSEPEESEQFLKKLHFVMEDSSDTTGALLGNKMG